MCMFSRPVERVSGTRIFATADGAGRQSLAYEMAFEALGELSMVLPIPVTPGAAEDAVRFVDLSAWPRFFGWLELAFPSELALQPLTRAQSKSPLAVHTVGRFEASFVPDLSDFERLDARFRLDPAVWDALPGYRDWGFVVVKLSGRSLLDRLRGARETPLHPIALSFPTREPERLFFPTVHVHDGAVHARAHFDHTLYGQTRAEVPGGERGTRTVREIAPHMTVPLIDADAPIVRLALHGELDNQDTWMPLSGS